MEDAEGGGECEDIAKESRLRLLPSLNSQLSLTHTRTSCLQPTQQQRTKGRKKSSKAHARFTVTIAKKGRAERTLEGTSLAKTFAKVIQIAEIGGGGSLRRGAVTFFVGDLRGGSFRSRSAGREARARIG